MRQFEKISDNELDELLTLHYRINELIEDTFSHVKHLITPEFREMIGEEHLKVAVEEKIRTENYEKL